MDRFNALGRGMQIMLVAGVLLLLDTFFAWQKVTVSILGVEAASVKANAWHGFWGVVMGLLVIVLVAWLVARLAAVDIPLPVSSAMLAVGLAVVILLFALIKNLADDYSTFWSYLGVGLAALVAVGAWLQVQESGGVDTLRSDASSLRPAPAPAAGADTTPASPPPSAPTEPAAPATPPPAAAPSAPPPAAAAPSEPTSPPPSSLDEPPRSDPQQTT
jgi:hypothetical protein